MTEQPAPGGTGDDRPALDIRLVPAAVTGWSVTVAAILWPVGYIAAALCAIGGLVVISGRCQMPKVNMSVLLTVLLVGTGFSVAAAIRHDAVEHHPLAARTGESLRVQVRVTDDPRPIRGSGRMMIRGELLSFGDAGQRTSGAVVLFGGAEALGSLAVGDRAQMRAVVKRPKRHDLTVAALAVTGGVEVLGQAPVLETVNAVRNRFVQAARNTLPADQAAVLPALVLGDTSALDERTTEMFRNAGLTHLMAVSGANVSIVCGAVLLLGRLIGPRAAVVLAAVALAGFVMLVRPSPSVLRAAMMGAIALLGVLTSRRRQAVPALAATVLILLAVSPALAVDIGFALSVVATAALVVFAPSWSARLTARGWPKGLADALCVAVAAQLVTAPLIASISGTFSTASVAANLAAGVVVAPITVLGTAAAGVAMFSPVLAGVLVRFCGPELWWLLGVAEHASANGATALRVPSGVGGFAIVAAGTIVAVVLWRFGWFRWLTWSGALAIMAAAITLPR